MAALRQSDLEQDLEFVGFISLISTLRKDSHTAITSLLESNHRVVIITGLISLYPSASICLSVDKLFISICLSLSHMNMIIGDAALTACHVASQTGLCSELPPILFGEQGKLRVQMPNMDIVPFSEESIASFDTLCMLGSAVAQLMYSPLLPVVLAKCKVRP